MNIDKEFIVEQINTKNKKCKLRKNKLKNAIKTIKLHYINLKPTNIADLYNKYACRLPDIYSITTIKSQTNLLKTVANLCQERINSQIMTFRSVKGCVFIDYIAKDCVFYCIRHKNSDVLKYINQNYGFTNLFLKEKQILPYLVIKYLYIRLLKLLKYMVNIERNIAIGAKQNLFIFWRKYTLSRVYGIIKYNSNLLKYISISKINITKCVFNFLSKLNKCQIEVDVIINLIQGLLPYTSFRGITSIK